MHPETISASQVPALFQHTNNYGYVRLLPALHYYEPDGPKGPVRSKLIPWHGEYSNDEFIFDRDIYEHCTTDVALLKSGCMKFMVSFLVDNGIILFAVGRSPVLVCTGFSLLT